MATFARTYGAAVFGVGAELVDVQVSVGGKAHGGSNAFRIVGLPDSALREGKERIQAAIRHGGWAWPRERITVNLAPAAARKQGPALDLPIALGLLLAMGYLQLPNGMRSWLCLGELGLDGSVRPVRGVVASVEAARRENRSNVLVPWANAEEAAALPGVRVYGLRHLDEAVGHLNGLSPLEPHEARPWLPAARELRTSPVRGQPAALRAAWIAAVGRHNLLLSGAPGTGKTLLAREVRDLLPAMTHEEAVEVSRVHSIAGLLDGGLRRRRPFRAPHHTTSMAGLVGGGSMPRPGEVSLAHLGVLFLDELPEFRRSVLEALRQPMEDGFVTVSRAVGHATFPSEALVVAAMNPCPCGWFGVGARCTCHPSDVTRYARRISGPVRDRFDMCVTLKPVSPTALVGDAQPAPFTLASIDGAVQRQRDRATTWKSPRPWNAALPPATLPGAVQLTSEARAYLLRCGEHFQLSARGIHRTLRVARTLADLAGVESTEVASLREALAYRE